MSQDNWQRVTLETCSKQISERVSNPQTSGYDRFVGLEHMQTGETKIRQWGSTQDVTSSMKRFEAGDILVARRNVYLKRAAQVDFDGVCSGDAIVVRPRGDWLCLSELLPFVLNTERFWQYANSNADGSMSKRLSVQKLMSYEFALPPLEEQEKLVYLLEQLDDFQQKQREVLHTAEVALGATSKHIFKKYDHKSYFKKLASVCTKTPQSGLYKPKKFYGKGVDMVHMENLFSVDKITDNVETKMVDLSKEELKRFTLTENDLLFGRRSLVLEGAGRCVLSQPEHKTFVFESSIIRVTIDTSKVLPSFVFEWFRSAMGKKYIASITTFTTVAGVKGKDVAKLPVPIPSLSEQKKVVSTLSHFRTSLHEIKAENTKHAYFQKQITEAIFS